MATLQSIFELIRKIKQLWWKLMAEKALLPRLQGDCSSKIRRYSSIGFQSVFIISLQNQVRYTFSHYILFFTLDYIRWIKERNNTCIFQKICRRRNLCHSVNWMVAKRCRQVTTWRNSTSQSPLFYLFNHLHYTEWRSFSKSFDYNVFFLDYRVFVLMLK